MSLEARQQDGLRVLRELAEVQRADETTVTLEQVRPAGQPRRFSWFSVIGGFVFLFGLFLQIGLVRSGVWPSVAYAVQGIVSVELSFMLNRYVTWGDRSVGFRNALWKWNTQKAATTLISIGVNWLLIHVGVNYIVANVAITAVATPMNFILGNRWSFAEAVEAIPPLRVSMSALPSVSVIIPCRNNQATISKTLQSLLAQDYYGLREIILVGDVGDETWGAVPDHPFITIVEQQRVPGLRDPALKRDVGFTKASGDVIAFCDSDIVMDSDWLSKAVSQLIAQEGGAVAGGMRRIDNSYWGRFVDQNSLAAKTPRLEHAYRVTVQNFGRKGTKPPVGANIVMTRETYDACPLDKTWMHGYEDYEWMWRMASQRHRITFTDELTAAHHHRTSFGALLREYRRAAEGCAFFTLRHPASPLARKRMAQAVLLPVAALVGLLTVADVVRIGYGVWVPVAMAGGLGLLMARELKHAKTPEAGTYPFPALALSAAFSGQLSWTMLRNSRSVRFAGAIAAIILAGLGLRFWQLRTKPDWQVDEVTYSTIAKNFLHLQRLALPPAYGQPWKPFLFHPPFYNLLLARWFGWFGASIYHARVLGILCVVIMFSLLAWYLWREYGRVPAVFTILFLVTDGWLLYVQRVSYMENVLMILVVGTILCLQQALKTEQWKWYAVVGVMAGATAIFKHTGAYMIGTVVVAYMFTRKNHWKYLMTVTITGVIILLYIWFMIHTDGLQSSFTKPFSLSWGRHNYYVEQTLVQLRRTLGAQKNGGGGLTSPSQFFHLLFSRQYAEFIPSFLAVVAGVFFLVRDYWRCWKVRSFAPLQGHVTLTAWTTTGVVVFSAIALHFSQYFILFLVPLYCYLWTSVVKEVQWRHVGRMAVVTGTIAICALGYTSFQARIHLSQGNVLQEAIDYVRGHVPKGDLVISSTPIAYALPPQPWCTQRDPHITEACLSKASYIVTWTTYLQPVNPESNPGFGRLLTQSRPIHIINGFNGQVTIWKVERRDVVANNGGRARSTAKRRPGSRHQVLQHRKLIRGIRKPYSKRTIGFRNNTGA